MIRLDLPLPPSLNQLTRAGVNAKSGRVYKPGAKLRDEYKGWVRLAAIGAGVAGIGLGGHLSLTVRWHLGKGQRLDWDNGLKILGDSLADAIGFNDRQICEGHVYRMAEQADRPHCEVELKELE